MKTLYVVLTIYRLGYFCTNMHIVHSVDNLQIEVFMYQYIVAFTIYRLRVISKRSSGFNKLVSFCSFLQCNRFIFIQACRHYSFCYTFLPERYKKRHMYKLLKMFMYLYTYIGSTYFLGRYFLTKLTNTFLT
jgi:hypothetical protein